MKQLLYILQGPPGSGKSTFAFSIASRLQDSGVPIKVCSTDSYSFDADGIYRFNPELLNENHRKNQEVAKEAMNLGFSVVVDNTNIKAWESKEYVLHAVKLGIPVVFIRIVGDFSSKQKVHPDKIKSMLNSMETLTLETVLNSRKP